MTKVIQISIPDWAVEEAEKKNRRYIRAVITDGEVSFQSLSKRGWKHIKQPQQKSGKTSIPKIKNML